MAIGVAVLSILFVSGSAFAQIYGSNVTGTKGQAVPLPSNGGSFTVDNSATTGTTLKFGGGITGPVPIGVVTQSLSSLPTGRSPPPNTGPGVYANIVLSIPPVDSVSSGATAQVCITSSNIGSNYVLYIYNIPTQTWLTGTNTVITGTTICATFSVTDLQDPLVLAAPPAPYNYTWAYIAVALVVVVVVILAAAYFMRRKPKPTPTV